MSDLGIVHGFQRHSTIDGRETPTVLHGERQQVDVRELFRPQQSIATEEVPVGIETSAAQNAWSVSAICRPNSSCAAETKTGLG